MRKVTPPGVSHIRTDPSDWPALPTSASSSGSRTSRPAACRARTVTWNSATSPPGRPATVSPTGYDDAAGGKRVLDFQRMAPFGPGNVEPRASTRAPSTVSASKSCFR